MLLLAAIYKSTVSKLIAVACAAGWLLLAIAALAFVSVQAQEQTSVEDVVKTDTHLLVYPIRVRDKRGAAATVLTEHDLVLKDDDHVTSGLYLYAGVDSVSLLFALDQSGSLRNIISQQRAAAVGLINRFGERSRVAVMRFAQKPTLVVPFTRDSAIAAEAFAFPVKPNQHTAIFDAADAAVRAFDSISRLRSERRIVLLISDGLDNASATKSGSIIKAAFEKQISFYVIHLPLFEPRDGRLAVRSPAKGFRELAEKTGGKYFLAGNVKSALASEANAPDLAPIFQAIEDDLRSQYLLGWYLSEVARDGRNHRFSISLPAGAEYQFGNFNFARRHEFFYQVDGKIPTK
jgi:Ca-activated chloride channel family protein